MLPRSAARYSSRLLSKPPRGLFTSRVCRSFSSLSSVVLQELPKDSFIELPNDVEDEKNRLFQYSWGNWLTNDAKEHEIRETKFSMKGLGDVLYALSKILKDYSPDDAIRAPIDLPTEGITVLGENITNKNMGILNPNEFLHPTQITSIHEGRHHRIYKIQSSNDKSYILRIPYFKRIEPYDSKAYSERIKSEVATMDFLQYKNLKNDKIGIPKVLCYGTTTENSLEAPFILMEYIDGELLMRKWDPRFKSGIANEEVENNLKNTYTPMLDSIDMLLGTTFNKFGSLYFTKDVDSSLQNDLPYDGEENHKLIDRWRIGPSTDSIFWRFKQNIKGVENLRGPWLLNESNKFVNDLIQIEYERIEQTSKDEKILKTLNYFKSISSYLINSNFFNDSSSNLNELFKPKLFHPYIDPMNIISGKNGKKYLIDFESTSIKPFFHHKSPDCIDYSGPSIFDIEKDVPNMNDLPISSQEHIKFLFDKTRNQYFYEKNFSKHQPILISNYSPTLKRIRNPFTLLTNLKNDSDYIQLKDHLFEIMAMWPRDNLNTKDKDVKLPVDITEEEIDQHMEEFAEYYDTIKTNRFGHTQGWIPRLMFEELKKEGVIAPKKDNSGDHEIVEPKI